MCRWRSRGDRAAPRGEEKNHAPGSSGTRPTVIASGGRARSTTATSAPAGFGCVSVLRTVMSASSRSTSPTRRDSASLIRSPQHHSKRTSIAYTGWVCGPHRDAGRVSAQTMIRAISTAVMILGTNELDRRGPVCSGSTQAWIPFHRRNRANWRAIPRRPATEPADSPARGRMNASAASLVSTRSSAARSTRNRDRNWTR